jgi:uncharacterized membrane protein YgdD (TMEM256/DUF423 family)
MKPNFIVIGAIFGLLGVLAGTFAAHVLKDRLSPGMLAIFETGVRYQMYHSLALLVVGCLHRGHRQGSIHVAGWLFIAGIVVFSGSLYTLALTDTRWWGAITPVGGVAFLTGWAALVIGAFVPTENSTKHRA